MRDDTLNKLCLEVIELLERDGIAAFDRFARLDAAPLRYTSEGYRGGNAFKLWAVRELRGYSSPYWMTFRQAKEDDAAVRKGEKGTTVIYWSSYETAEGETVPFAKAYTVFNADQIHGLDPKFHPSVPRSQGLPRHAEAEDFMDNLGIRRQAGARACYVRPPVDTVIMPPTSAFATQEAYYATLFHEAVHWTGNDKRSPRSKGKVFGDPDYAMEELVAELGAALLCRRFSISKEPREDHAAYLASWLKALKSDPKALWSACTSAERAVDWMVEEQASMLPVGLRPAIAA